MSTAWNYVAHIRKPGQQEVIELTGTFVGNHMQAFAHLQSLARLHEGLLAVHRLELAKATDSVKRLTEPLLLPAPEAVAPPAVSVEPPALPDGCEWVDNQPSYEVEEYQHHGNKPSDREAAANRLH